MRLEEIPAFAGMTINLLIIEGFWGVCLRASE